MKMEPSKWTVISAMFLVAGTCIGGGMLATPVVSGLSGFFPSTIVMLVCWFMMTLSALLLMEVSLWMGEGEFLISMATRILGPYAKVICWILYLFIAYGSLVAYTAASGEQIAHSIFPMSKQMGCTLFVLVFGFVIYFGGQFLGKVNTLLFSAMIITYFALVGMGVDEMNVSLLAFKNWSYSFASIPLLLTSFSFQTMVPSLTPYLKRHAKSLRLAIIGGTTITLLFYLIWQAVILGIVPSTGPNSLATALTTDVPAIVFLKEHVHGFAIVQIGQFFMFFAIVTSFLGIAFGLFDFLSDGLHIPEKGWGRIGLTLLIIIPTLLFAVYFEKIFFKALDTTGGYGDSILNGIIPALMVWVGRYRMNLSHPDFSMPGGKWLLSLVILFFIGTLTHEILSQIGLTPSIYDH